MDKRNITDKRDVTYKTAKAKGPPLLQGFLGDEKRHHMQGGRATGTEEAATNQWTLVSSLSLLNSTYVFFRKLIAQTQKMKKHLKKEE